MINHKYTSAPYIKDAVARDGVFHVVNTNVAFSIVKSNENAGYTAHYFFVKDGEVSLRSIDVNNIDEKTLSMLDRITNPEVSFSKQPIDGYSNFTEMPYNVHEIFQCVRLIYSKFLHMRAQKPRSGLIQGVLPSCEESTINVTFEESKKLNVAFKYTYVIKNEKDDKMRYFESVFSSESGMVDVLDMYFIPKVVQLFLLTLDHFKAEREALINRP